MRHVYLLFNFAGITSIAFDVPICVYMHFSDSDMHGANDNRILLVSRFIKEVLVQGCGFIPCPL